MDCTFLTKIPLDTYKRLQGYAANGRASSEKAAKEHQCDRIITACSVLYDCGFLNFKERINCSRYFRSLVYTEQEVTVL